MSTIDPLDEQKAVKLRARLWGAAVLIALLVIFLPLLLDGSGSESQYRRVESLRAEPPRILDAKGVPEPVEMVEKAPTPAILEQEGVAARLNALETVKPVAEVQIAEAVQPQVVAPTPRTGAPMTKSAEPLTAWVVQAGSFGDEANALAVRNKLRRAGFPSFVTPANDTAIPMFRVRVGPMINLQQAEANRNKVMRLLDREAIVVSYP